MDQVIVLDRLTKQYRNSRGIREISLSVGRGEIFGFLGPNGAGKTTAMKIMTGILSADSGEVWINGFRVSNQFEKALAGVGSMIEEVTPIPYLTAYENLRLCASYYYGVGDARIDECLELVGLLPFKKERAGAFSLGMKQRLGIAMALVSSPQVLILDEPLNGLDVAGMVEMRKLFLQLGEAGVTIFISSHLIHDVELTCSRVGIVYDGRLLGTESKEEILGTYSSLEDYYLSEVESHEKLQRGV